MSVTKGDSDLGYHGYPITLVRNSRVIIWSQNRKLREEERGGQTERVNGKRREKQRE